MILKVVEEPLNYVIPAWTAGIQADTDVCGRILHTGMSAIHAGMTMICSFNVLWGERKIMTYSLVTCYLGIASAIWNRQNLPR